jgi:hypothetical protein
MDGRDLRAKVAKGRAIAVTRGWAAVSGASGALARTAGFLARGSARLAVALRGLRRRLDVLALNTRERARLTPPAATPTAEVLADSTVVMATSDATIVMPLPPVVPGLPRVPPPPGAATGGGARLPPPPLSRRTEGSLRS